MREELSNLHYDPASIETQSLDMTCGDSLRFLGFELSIVQGKHGEARVQSRLVEEAGRLQPEPTPVLRRLLGRYHPLHFTQRYLKAKKHLLGWQLLRDTCQQVNSIQVNWRDFPLGLALIVLIGFGWRSFWPVIATVLCGLLFALFRWRDTLAVCLWVFRSVHQRAGTIGTLSAVWVVGSATFLAWDFYSTAVTEKPVLDPLPGFFWGEYISELDSKPVEYGLYLPPHFKNTLGRFPLIVFLHGVGERGDSAQIGGFRQIGLSKGIRSYAEKGRRFEFAVLFPMDPSGWWRFDPLQTEKTMELLDKVIGRHRIDPARVHLTGHSSGGFAVWRLAQQHPERWESLVPVAAIPPGDMERVKELPCWMFNGSRDEILPMKTVRRLAGEFKAVGAEVHYTEFPNEGHIIWSKVYDTAELYEWLETMKKG